MELRLICFFFSFAALIHCLSGNQGQNQTAAVWRRRAEEAVKTTGKHYDPNPEAIATHLNLEVQEQLSEKRGSRKMRSGGGCEAANPIDKCWRCRPDWEKNRQALAGCALGFAKGATGGKGGRIYKVTDPSDNDVEDPKKGTLRHAVIQKEPLWIIFGNDMNIKLSQELIFQSDKTVDGRGANVHIANGAGFMLQFVKNVIIHGIHFHNIIPASGGMIRDSVDHKGLRGPSDGDAVSIFGSSNIWVDHCTLSHASDGLIDVVQASTAITISNSHFSDHDKAILLGADDAFREDKKMQVTVAFNRFDKGLTQRLPCIRFGFVHVVNNDYIQWKMYAIGGLMAPTVLSQGNRFLASDDMNAKEVTKKIGQPEEFKNWAWKSEGDVFLNGAFFSGNQNANIAETRDGLGAAPGSEVQSLTQSAGVLLCRRGVRC